MISRVVSKVPTREIKDFAGPASAALDALVDLSPDLASPAHFARAATIASVALAADRALIFNTAVATDAARAPAALVARAALVASDAPAVLSADTAALESGAWKTEPLPLWPDTESSEAIQLWEQMRPKLPRPGAGYGPDTARGEPIDDWGFWIDWYESWLEGKPFDLELQKKVARISGEDWQHEDNPGHVNEIISKMYLRFQLSQWIEFVEQELVATPQASASVSLRGHNNPPEILPSVEQQEVLQALVRARTELASDVPDVEVLTDASEEIEHWARRALKYLGAKADLFVTEASKELGREGVKWLVRGGSVLIVAKLLNIAEILRAFAGL